MRGGDIHIARCDGRWAVAVNGRSPEVVGTLEVALERAGRVSFKPGESPGEWRIHLDPR